jgi:hypothetical protein
VGLEAVEFVLAAEEAFQIAIPDEEVHRMATPRDVVEYLLRRLGEADEQVCLEQRAFYRLRRACVRLYQTPRGTFRPETRWVDILPRYWRRHNWSLVHHATGVPQWPPLRFLARLPPDVATAGGTARYLAREAKAALKGDSGWSRGQIEEVVARLIREVLAIKQFGWDQHFVKDLGVN